MKSPSVSIVIVNWNNWQDTIECVESLLKNNHSRYDVIVVDNKSENDSYERLARWSDNNKRISLLQTKTNLGFAGGNNIGIRNAIDRGANYILLLNNDTIVEADFLQGLVNTIEANSDTGIVTGKILSHNNKKIWYSGGKISWLRGGGYHFRKGTTNKDKYDKPPFEVNFISGCMMLIKREVFEKIGLLDESYFLYNEDVEFCIRSSRANIKMLVNPASVIYHKERSRCGGWKSYHIYYLIRNKLILMKRHAPNSILLWCFYFIVVIMGGTLSLKWMFQGQTNLVTSYKRAIIDFVRAVEGKSKYF